MAEQHQELEKKTEKGNRSSSQPSLIRKCEEFADITSNNTKRSMFCMMSFSQGLRKNNQECLEHFNDTVAISNLELIPAAFEILCNIECTGTNKIRYDSILSDIASNIMEIGHLNSQIKQDQIEQMAKNEEMKHENSTEVIEILDDVDDAIYCSEEINENQNSVGHQATSTRFKSNIVADKFIANLMKDLPPTDSGFETANTSCSSQENHVAFIEKENSHTGQTVEEKSTDIASFMIKGKDTDDLYLSGIPFPQMQSVMIDLTEEPQESTSEDVISNSEEASIPRKIPRLQPMIEISPDKVTKKDHKLTAKGSLDSDKIQYPSQPREETNQSPHSGPKMNTDTKKDIRSKGGLDSDYNNYNEDASRFANSSSFRETSSEESINRIWGSHNREDQGQKAETNSMSTIKTNLGSRAEEILEWNVEATLECKTKTYENNETPKKKEHGDLYRETNVLMRVKRHIPSDDFDYDRSLFILSRVSPYRDSTARRRGRPRKRRRGSGKSVTARNEVEGEENGVTERCSSHQVSTARPRGRPRKRR